MKTKTFKIASGFKYLLVMAILLYAATSCNSFTEVDLPKSQLASTAVFDNYASANAAMADIYIKVRDNGMISGNSLGLSNILGHYADELDSYAGGTNPLLPFYNNTLLASNTVISDSWNSAYNQIYAANSVMERSERSTKLTANEKRVLTGEALFMRGLLHFYLTNLFGEVPFVTSTDYRKNSSLKKLPVSEIYNLIIIDLETAAGLLDAVYKNADKIRPNRLAAKALLARVYLYHHMWGEASNAASAVLNAQNLYTLENNLKSVFLKNSKETIWQLQPSVAGKNTDEAAVFVLLGGPPAAVSLTDGLAGSFAFSDLRKSSWIGSVKNGLNTWYFAYKYKEFSNTASSTEYSKVLRLAEQYLIRAEARANAGDLIGAKEDLNKIRKRAGLESTPAETKQEILDAILKERRWELFTEYGHRFFDLKRTGNIDAVLSDVKKGWKTNNVLFPLPQNELNANPNLLPQNNGY
ncbi:RagB/SusD family nutrient uptake outer membrane protein [Flavobacterium collinsii]|nr:RagB/SusD family nutrient uptake outer membrane protein [Flavobacterium collinsii]